MKNEPSKLKERVMPYAPRAVAVSHLSETGKLCTEEQINWVLHTLKDEEHYYTRGELNKLRPSSLPEFKYSIDVHDGIPYAVYQHADKTKRKDSDLLGKGGQSVVKPVQNLLTGEFFALRTDLHPYEIASEFNILQKLQFGIGYGFKKKVTTYTEQGRKTILKGRILMPYIPGSNLEEFLHRYESESEKQMRLMSSRPDPQRSAYWLDMLINIAKELQSIHAAGIIHNDIKEGNIVINTANRQPKIIDFGLAYKPVSSSTVTAGTPSRMAPESIAKGCYNEKTDIFSFGKVLINLSKSERLDDNTKKALYEHGMMLIDPNPEKRPTLDETIRYLATIKNLQLPLSEKILNIVMINLSDVVKQGANFHDIFDVCAQIDCDEIQFIDDHDIPEKKYIQLRQSAETHGLTVRNTVLTPVDVLSAKRHIEQLEKNYIINFYYVTPTELSENESKSLVKNHIYPISEDSNMSIQSQRFHYFDEDFDPLHFEKMLLFLKSESRVIDNSYQTLGYQTAKALQKHIAFTIEELQTLKKNQLLTTRLALISLRTLNKAFDMEQVNNAVRFPFSLTEDRYHTLAQSAIHIGLINVDELADSLSDQDFRNFINFINGIKLIDKCILVFEKDASYYANDRDGKLAMSFIEGCFTGSSMNFNATQKIFTNAINHPERLPIMPLLSDFTYFSCATYNETRGKLLDHMINTLYVGQDFTDKKVIAQKRQNIELSLCEHAKFYTIPHATLKHTIETLQSERSRLKFKYIKHDSIVENRIMHLTATIKQLEGMLKNNHLSAKVINPILKDLAEKMENTSKVKKAVTHITGVKFYGRTKKIIDKNLHEIKGIIYNNHSTPRRK